MKYSIRGNMLLNDGSPIVDILNTYPLWRLITDQQKVDNGTDVFTFEVWITDLIYKDSIWEQLVPFVDRYGSYIDWHQCTHDELYPQPCVINETYFRR